MVLGMAGNGAKDRAGSSWLELGLTGAGAQA